MNTHETAAGGRTLVVGGLGFLGSRLVRVLCAEGRPTVVLDRPEASDAVVAGTGAVIHRGDFGAPFAATPAGAFRDVGAVLHYAWTNLPADAGENITADAVSNIVGSLALFDAARVGENGRGAHTILFAGSGGTVYGRDARLPASEEAPPKPFCAYGVTKLAVEHYLRLHTLGRGFVAPLLKGRETTGDMPPPLARGIVLRYGNPYGRTKVHSRGKQGVIDVALSRLLREEPLEIWGDGSVVRDYFHIDDLTRISLGVLERAPAGFSVYNVGSGRGVSLKEVLQEIERVTGRTLRKVFRPARPIDVPKIVLDVSKLERETGLRPKISLSDGIAMTWEQLRRET